MEQPIAFKGPFSAPQECTNTFDFMDADGRVMFVVTTDDEPTEQDRAMVRFVLDALNFDREGMYKRLRDDRDRAEALGATIEALAFDAVMREFFPGTVTQPASETSEPAPKAVNDRMGRFDEWGQRI